MSLRRHGTLRNPLRGLGEALKDFSFTGGDDAKKKERENTIKSLSRMLQSIKAQPDVFIGAHNHDLLRIDLLSGLSQQQQPMFMGPFFRPLSPAIIKDKYPIDMDDASTSYDIQGVERSIDHGPRYVAFGPGPEWRVTLVCSHIECMMSYPRKPNGESLQWIVGLRHSSSPLPADYAKLSSHGRPEWRATTRWFLPSHKSPHTRVVMYTAVEGEEGVLLREEVIMILFLMIDRLQSEAMKNHVIAPVMLISIMGECHGRVLIAHFNGNNLVIQMSSLHRCYSGDKGSYELFLSYLAGEEDRRGNTTTLLSKRAS